MKTVIDSKNELVINKSHFITLYYRVDNLIDVNEKLKKVKLEYKDATHYCYAYIVDNNIKASDDGEPSGTAGLPILNILKNTSLLFGTLKVFLKSIILKKRYLMYIYIIF